MVFLECNSAPTKTHPNQKCLKSSADDVLPPLQPSCQEKHRCVWYLTLILWCGGDGGGVKGSEAARPVTAGQVCVSPFVGVKPLDILDKRPWHLNICTPDTKGYF